MPEAALIFHRRDKKGFTGKVEPLSNTEYQATFSWWHMVAQPRNYTGPHPVHTELPLQKIGSIFLSWAKSAFDEALISAKERSGLDVLCREEGDVCAQAAIIP